MGKHKLLIFPSANQDLQNTVNYVNEFSPDAALKMYDESVEGIGGGPSSEVAAGYRRVLYNSGE